MQAQFLSKSRALPARRLATVAAAISLAWLAGCGGGGGDDAGTPTVPSAGPVAISSANYEGVSQKTVAAADYVNDSGSLLSLGAQVAPSGGTLVAFSRLTLARLPGVVQKARPTAVGATSTEVLECSGGGSISVVINDANNNQQADSGDSFVATASNCVEDGATVNGVLRMAISATSGDLSGTVWSATVAITLQNLRAASAAGSATGNGDMTLTIASTGLETGSLEIRANSLTMSGTVGGVNDTITLSNWRSVSATTLSGGSLRTSTTVTGTLASSALASGTVEVSTPQPLVTLGTSIYPSSGQLLAVGASGSKVRITAQSSTTVLLELDANGDGTYETSVTRAWTTLI